VTTDTYTDAHTRYVCLSVCLSRTSCLSREQRGIGRPKIGTEVAHGRHTWLGHHFQGQRSRSPGRFAHRRVGASGCCSDGRQNVLAVGTAATLPSALSREAFRHQRGKRRAAVHIVAAARLQLVYINSVRGANRLWDESSVGRDVHGAKCPWGEKSWHHFWPPGGASFLVFLSPTAVTEV